MFAFNQLIMIQICQYSFMTPKGILATVKTHALLKNVHAGISNPI